MVRFLHPSEYKIMDLIIYKNLKKTTNSRSHIDDTSFFTNFAGLCVTEKITLNAGYTGSTFLWSTGATTQTITVTASDPQWYWVTVNNQGCTGTDSLFIDIRCDVNMPNAFSPNGDGSNDMFKPITKKVDTYQLHVYNRWGNEVYYYSGPGSGGGWDGTYKGVDAEVGVYDYYIKASFINGISYEQQGNVTLLR